MIWLVVGAVLLAAATWSLVLGLAWPLWIAVLVSVTLLVILLVIIAFRVLRALNERQAICDDARRGASRAHLDDALQAPPVDDRDAIGQPLQFVEVV